MRALMESAIRAVRSFFTPGMVRVFILSVIVSILVLVAFVVLASVGFSWAAEQYGLTWIVPWVGGFGSAFIAWLLFPCITPVIVSFFDVRITRLIEQHDYPAAPVAREAPFWREFWHDVRFAIKAVLLNILVLPLYLVPGVNVLLFYVLNGYLLGREYFVMAARRHMPVAEAEALRRKHAWAVMGGGVLITLLATIPVLNLFAPFWGVAVMVHLYHYFRNTPLSQILPVI